MQSSKFKPLKKYKAIILDVDGTTIPLQEDALPSDKVKSSLDKAKDKIFVGLATSRGLFQLRHIISYLDLSGPSIINGGAQIIESKTGKIIWEKTISKKDIEKIKSIADESGIKIFLTGYGKDLNYEEYKRSDGKILIIWSDKLNKDTTDEFIKKISHIPTLTALSTPSWTQGKFAVLVTNAQATKQHGILEVAKILGISTKEIIGVGDGYNDFPLLMACGLKVAMGNAVPELKAIADYIAPTVEEDGVADVIERFVL